MQASHLPTTSVCSNDSARPDTLRLLGAALAAVLPTQIAFQLAPSATLLNQCLAVVAWGLWLVLLAPGLAWRPAMPLLGALALVALSAAWSVAAGDLPRSLGLVAIALLACAAALVAAGAATARQARSVSVFGAVFVAVLLAGLVGGAVALVQVFAPTWANGSLVAHSGVPGRAVGNLRQPNHLCSLLLWALVALVALCELRWPQRAAARLNAPWLAPVLLWMAMAWLVLAVELSASRTGAAGLLLLLLWGLLDRRLSPLSRRLLVATPLVYALAYGLMALLAEFGQQALGAGARLDGGGMGEGGSPNSRLNIWRNVLAMVMARPWTGVGFGEFNIAWTLTPFAQRPTAFFDNSHNLPLQLAVELGLPLAGLVLGLLGWALWRAARRAWAAPAMAGALGRSALMMVLLVGLHSLVEYPLWYAYFLLPAAFVWGWMLGLPATTRGQASTLPTPVEASAGASARQARPLGAWVGALMLAGGCMAMLDYWRVAMIYSQSPGTLELRIAQGQRSLFFAHHADYAAATNAVPAASKALGMARTTHALLDTRLMIAWAGYLLEQGHTDLALTLAQRLRDFNHPEAQPFFSACDVPDSTVFPCQPPQAAHDWREFVAASRQP